MVLRNCLASDKPMKNVLRPFLVPTLATLVVGFTCTPTNAAHRGGTKRMALSALTA